MLAWRPSARRAQHRRLWDLQASCMVICGSVPCGMLSSPCPAVCCCCCCCRRFDALLALCETRQDGFVDENMRTRTRGISDTLEVSGVGWLVRLQCRSSPHTVENFVVFGPVFEHPPAGRGTPCLVFQRKVFGAAQGMASDESPFFLFDQSCLLVC